jgi:hypothetical protein
MKDLVQRIINIVTYNDYIKEENLYENLFEVQLPPEDINLWKIRYNFNMGTPLLGDLLLDLEQEERLEIHPFPEWVVQLKTKDVVKSKPYLVVPNFSKPLIKKINRKSINEKIELIQNEIDTIKIDDLIAFEYDIGINILVPAFIPHFFISSKINREAGEKPPYLQVFEPNLEVLTKNLKIKTTYFFKLPFSVTV